MKPTVPQVLWPIRDNGSGLFRLAWLPNDVTLLRIEADVVALQPLDDDASDGDQVVALAPPTLISLRCDTLQNSGDSSSFDMDEVSSLGEGTPSRGRNDSDAASEAIRNSMLPQHNISDNIHSRSNSKRRHQHCRRKVDKLQSLLRIPWVGAVSSHCCTLDPSIAQ